MKITKRKIGIVFKATALVLLFSVLAASFCGCMSTKAADLLDGIQKETVSGRETDDKFRSAQLDFALKVFSEAVKEQDNKNTLISPTSLMLALAIEANGAKGDTLKEMEQLLGCKIGELNEYLYSYAKSLSKESKSKLKTANSVWFNENGFSANKNFLQTASNYYDAGIFAAPFDSSTVKDINRWIEKNTDGMLKDILKEIDPETVMYIINTVCFESEWDEKYEGPDIKDGVFTALDGTKKDVKFLNSHETNYIKLDNAEGFTKAYKGGDYLFAAILPDENISVSDFIKTLDHEKLMNALDNRSSQNVFAAIPEFTSDTDIKLNDTLKRLGMKSAFSSDADLSGLGVGNGNIYIDYVRQVTHLELDRNGTKAAAVTIIADKCEGAPMYDSAYYITLDRPFVYMILDASTNLPIFIGLASDVGN